MSIVTEIVRNDFGKSNIDFNDRTFHELRALKLRHIIIVT